MQIGNEWEGCWKKQDLGLFDHLRYDKDDLGKGDLHETLGAVIKLTDEGIKLLETMAKIKGKEYSNKEVEERLKTAESCMRKIKRGAEEELSEAIGNEW
ncbi:MAG: hypothetical protein ACP5SJ_01640 [Candidatus Micrarchaeia archaeon]